MVSNSQSRTSWPIAYGQAPLEGSRSMMQALDFTSSSKIGINLTFDQQAKKLEFVQSIYVDNSANTQPLICTFHGTEQTITIPAGNQAYFPVLAPADNCKADFSTTGGGIINIWFLSCPMAPAVWATSAASSSASVSSVANTSNGTSSYAAYGGSGNALLTNTTVQVKASAGNLYGVSFVNTGAAAAYVQMFDALAATLGTTTPKIAFWVPAGGAWEEKFTDEAKISFATGILIAATTAITGSTAPATGIIGTVIYK